MNLVFERVTPTREFAGSWDLLSSALSTASTQERDGGHAKKSRNEEGFHDVIDNKGPILGTHDVYENKGDEYQACSGKTRECMFSAAVLPQGHRVLQVRAAREI
jgi:hypothetical protein